MQDIKINIRKQKTITLCEMKSVSLHNISILQCGKTEKYQCFVNLLYMYCSELNIWPGRVAQSVGHLTRKSGVLGSIPGLATYFRFSFHFFKKGSCQLLAKVCARSTG